MADPRPVSALAVTGGVIFILVWLGGAALLGTLKLMAGLMANDSGTATGGQHLGLLGGVVIGQLLTGLAGIPAGLSFFWRSRRKMLVWAFAVMLVIGLAIQAGAVFGFAR